MDRILQPKDKDSFSFTRYTNIQSFTSYFIQVEETLKHNPRSCLVIGQGDNVVPSILRSQGVEVDTFDIVEELQPTYVGDLRMINHIVNKKYDVVLCCEVLEHLPFEFFEECIFKIKQISKNAIIISLPVFGLAGFIKVWTPKYIKFIITISINYYKPGHNVMCKNHYWEINSKGYRLKRIVDTMKKHLIIKERYRVKENPYHMFFILEVVE